jgi:hypothetical protein
MESLIPFNVQKDVEGSRHNLSQDVIHNLHGATERNYKKPLSGWLVSKFVFKDRISSM